MIAAILVGIPLLIFLIALLVVSTQPQFGSTPSREEKKAFESLENYDDGRFRNQILTEMNIKLGKMIRLMVNPPPLRSPQETIIPKEIDSLNIVNYQSAVPRLTWFGHSAFLLEINGKAILIDPMFGEHAAPFSFAGPKRYSSGLPIPVEELPQIDAIIFSHDHYDHLDHGSILQLKDKTIKFYAPLGLGSHLRKWGVAAEKIEELNWWDETTLANISLVCAPARHFSGRALFDRNQSLWCSWIIKTDSTKIYFSGDGGYGPHFKEIGNRYGPFDLSMMECGQYNEMWEAIHMMPEETVQAALDVKSKLLLPIHWGAFTLAYHQWTDPIERAVKAAAEKNMAITTPAIGESMLIGKAGFPQNAWWKNY